MEFAEKIIDIIAEFSSYIFGLFSYLIELSNGILSGGNVAMFVLLIIIIWKTVKKMV